MDDIYPELKKIENELKEIKMLMLKSQAEKKPVRLGGLLKGAKITETDIEEAKKHLLKHTRG